MRTVFVLLILFGTTQMTGQKIIRKALLDTQTEYIQIDCNFCYQLVLRTAGSGEVRVEANMEGEYAQDLLVSMEEKGNTMVISPGFQPNFTNPNDKLSAHKVISISLSITVPEFRNISVFGTNSHVDVQGSFQKLAVKLSNGRCSLRDVSGTAEVETQKGDILLVADNGNIVAESAYGKVFTEQIPLGDNQYFLKTVEGIIQLKKTK
nr:hypothetical protein [Allomuricauda sp.]